MGGHDTVTGVNNIQYTAQFGNGVSGTIGLDDPTVFNRTAVLNLGARLGITPSALSALPPTPTLAFTRPDVVGNIRVDQAWGLFQISAAAHEVSGSYNILNTAAVPAGAVGVAAGAASGFGNQRTPRYEVGRFGDGCVADQEHPDRRWRRLQNRRELRRGDTRTSSRPLRLRRASRCSAAPAVPGAYQSIGFGVTTDAVFLPAVRAATVTQADEGLGRPWCVQPQLGSLLVVQPLGQLRFRSLRRQSAISTAKGPYCASLHGGHAGGGVTTPATRTSTLLRSVL